MRVPKIGGYYFAFDKPRIRQHNFKYETAIKAGKFAFIVHGTADEVAWAKELLNATQVKEVHEHMVASSK